VSEAGDQGRTGLPDGSYGMEADADMLYRAFVNLLANALQAMPQGGVLRLETSLTNGRDGNPRIQVKIRDTGHGIPPG